jgi:hypothetical protein
LKLIFKKIEYRKENLFGFGSTEDGKLGDFFELNSSKLINIKFFNDKKIKNFCCGAHSSYVLIG